MKVCYTTHLPNLTGASQSLLDILSVIKSEGVEPIVLLGKHGPLEAELVKREVPYRIIPYVHDMRSNSGVKNLLKPIINRIAVKRIKRFLVEEHIDLVHNNCFLSGVGMEAAYQAGIPYVCHNREFVQEDHGLELMDEDKLLFLLRNAAAAIEISDTVYQKYSALVPDAHYYVLHDGLEVNRYYLERQGILQGEHIEILLAGRIAPGKGQLEAIQAMEILEKTGDMRFHLSIVGGVGDPEYDQEIREYVQDHHVRGVAFLSFCDLKELRLKTDIALVCSKAEALGRVTVEGMLAGCLVIGAASGATPELIQDGETGLLYETGNPRDLAEKLCYAAEQSEKMNQIAKNGQLFAKGAFDIRTYVAIIAGLYREITNQKI